MHQDAGLVDFKLPASPDDKAAYRSWNQYKMIDLQLQYHIHWPNLEMWMNTKKPEWEEKIMWHYLSNMHCWATTNGFMFLGKVVFSKVLRCLGFHHTLDNVKICLFIPIYSTFPGEPGLSWRLWPKVVFWQGISNVLGSAPYLRM